MFSCEKTTGTIFVSNEYFSKLIAAAVSSCYGVAGMVPKGKQKVFDLLGHSSADKGVIVKGSMQGVNVDVHIMVTYGININAICDSIVNKVKFTVEQATGITVNRVTIRVDGMKAE